MEDWDPTSWGSVVESFQNTMFYVLYDFTAGKATLANIHLPPAEDDGPVLLKVTLETYEQTVGDLREMCINEGDEWMTTLLIRPEYTMRNTSDLEPLVPYILIAHIALVQKDPTKFAENLKSMKQWMPN
jgi:hypothetical protein